MKNKNNLWYWVRFTFSICLLGTANFAFAISKSNVTNALTAGSTINGMVFDSEKRGLIDVDVELQDEYSRFLARTRTTGGGRFSFTNLSAGTYQVRVMAQRYGFSEQTQQVEIINFNRGSAGVSNDTIYIDFYLQPIKNFTFAEAVGVTGSIFAQDVPDEARNLYNQALTDFAQKKIDSDIANLKKAIEIFPKYFNALNRLGDEFLKKQDFKAAQEILLKAIEINPKAADSFYMLGYSQYVLKQFAPSINSLRQSVIWSPRSAAAFLLLGMALRQLTKYDEAEIQMLKANELSKKKSADVHWQLALLYGNNLKKYNEAANELELFLKIQPDSKDVETIKKLIQKFREKANQGN